MAKREAGEQGDIELASQAIHHALQLEAFIVRREFVVGELAKKNSFLLRQDAGLQPLQQHALHFVRMLAYIFKPQDAFFDLRQIRRADQAGEHGKVTAP